MLQSSQSMLSRASKLVYLFVQGLISHLIRVSAEIMISIPHSYFAVDTFVVITTKIIQFEYRSHFILPNSFLFYFFCVAEIKCIILIIYKSNHLLFI